MRHFFKACSFITIFIVSLAVFGKEQVIFIRHGEKPKTDLGQLSCQGLNRSLMLPKYFSAHFSKPNYIFAPNPSVKNAGFSYVRPLATIEPTAIQLSMPVNTQIGYDQDECLVKTLLNAKYHHATIYVAWEHKHLVQITRLLLKHFNSQVKVPVWNGNNYNMVFVLTINWAKKNKVNFQVENEGFKHIDRACPIQ